MAETTQPPTREAVWLRDNWNREALGKHDRKWIAVKNEGVVASDPALESLLSQTINLNPLYAFVYFGPLQ